MFLIDQMMRRMVRIGTLKVIDAGGKEHLYAGTPSPSATVRINDPKLYLNLFFNPELYAGEAYMDGTLVVEQGSLRDFLTVFALNRNALRSQPWQRNLRKLRKTLRRLYQRNTAEKSRKNVAHHYDLSNDFYKLFLDKDMSYSCAYYTSPDNTLEVAQENKLRHIAAKLDLKPGQRVLDIGCGWGAMAIYIAEHYNVEVLGVTLSVEQHALATRRAIERGLSERVRFELRDYRDVKGPFDRIVSIGMFEHVGLNHFDEFFQKVAELLPSDGVALLHSIGRKGGPGTTGAWIRKYIFPGSYPPALSETMPAIERAGLWTTDIEILRLHYAETLRAWDDRFQVNRAKAAAMFDERFCRMWEFYLIVCEFAFRYGKLMNFQIQLTKGVNTLPLQRDYISASEAKLLASDQIQASHAD
jgi:cyclopropane-fatty-acyl-phospholipid synthase